MGRNKLLRPGQVLAAIEGWLVRHGEAPTIEELRQGLGVGSTRTVLRYLQELEEDGAIRRSSGARGIRLLRRPEAGNDTVAVPLVGHVPAGPLMLAEENCEAWVRVPRSLAQPGSSRFFLLRVHGDSMNRARVGNHVIEDGDLVLVRQESAAEPGDIIVALVDGEATIKRLARGDGYVALMPQSTNSNHQPILLVSDFMVQGKVVQVIKRGAELILSDEYYA